MKFPTVRIEGNTISADILDKISEGDYKGQQPKDFGFEKSVKVKDEIARAWADAQSLWKIFKSRTANLDGKDTGTPEVRKYWMIPFLGLLDYNLETSKSERLDNGHDYPISHREAKLDFFPVHIVGFKDSLQKAPEERSTLDIKPSNASRKMSPHAMVQEYVNLTEHTYGIITNGLQIRLLRDSSRLVKLSFLEFDIEQMMEEEVFADFALLFRVLHASRMPRRKEQTDDSCIEQYHQDSIESGARIREGLSEAVEKTIRTFANGFLKHPGNTQLREAIIEKRITPEQYYQHQLRLIYRLLFLMVIEERNLIYPDQHDKKLKGIYYQFYSVERLRKMVDKRYVATTNFNDQWEGLKRTFQLFESEKYGKALEIKALNGDLFGLNAIGLLQDCILDNQTMMQCMRTLTVFVNKNTQQLLRINYSSLNVEEFGSVYEGLLEYDPVFHLDGSEISFAFKEGTGRSSSGSHYTPEELVQPLIKHSLEYVIEDKLKAKDREDALLSIKVCDVACGSGHILLSAARRIATALAFVRTNEEQPAPSALRQAIRKVIRHCIYGVDKNPLAVELCKVALWLEAHNPGEPLGFLDHRIKCGDAIVGLAHREELENGITGEAFKTLPGDDKAIATAYSKRNKMERKELESTGIQLKAEFGASVQGNVQEAMEEYRAFVRLPEQTLDDIRTKQLAYRKFLNGKGYSFLKAIADTQVSQFFIPKNSENSDRLVTDAEFRQVLRGYKGWQLPKTSYANVVAQSQRFFHWFIEFPEVFQQGGFDCILGNPPYLGGTKISTFNSDAYFNYCKTNYFPAAGRCDLVGFFVRRIYDIQRRNGFHSIITTNTIAEGDTREGGLDQIVKNVGQIIYADKSVTWPGKANVVVTLYSVVKGNWTRKKVLSGREVRFISSYLSEDEFVTQPFNLKRNEGGAFMGSSITGDGFLVGADVYNSLVMDNAAYEEIIYKYINGSDFNALPSHISDKLIINLFDLELDVVSKEYPLALAIVENLVKPEREKKSPEVASAPWWKYWRIRKELYSAISKNERVLVLTRATSTHGLSFINNGKYVYSDAVVVYQNDSYWNFSFLQSSIHEDWAWRFSSRLKNDRRYSVSDAYGTYPFPEVISTDVQVKLANIGEQYFLHRKNLMSRMRLGLTRMYNLFHNEILSTGDIQKETRQPENACESFRQDILKLRTLHVQMDQTVLEAYGWQHIQLGHNFYDVDYLPENDRIRFTIHPNARIEILKRLLELNHKIHDEEVKRGLWAKKKSGKSKTQNYVQESNAQYGLDLK